MRAVRWKNYLKVLAYVSVLIVLLTPTTRASFARKSSNMLLLDESLHTTTSSNGEKIYVIGGSSASGALALVEVYDPATNTWDVAAPMPIPKRQAAAVALGGYIHVLGGDDRHFRYSLASDRWEELARMPETTTGRPALGLVDGRIYATIGNQWMYVYNSATDRWSSRTPVPVTRSIAGIASLNGKLYAIGGNEPGHVPSEIDRIDVYDPANDSWTIGGAATMPGQRTHLPGVIPVVDGRIYVAGGWNGYSAQSTVFVYDPTTDTWASERSMPTARYAAGHAAVDNKLHVIGGNWGGSGGHWLAANETLTPGSLPPQGTWLSRASMPTARDSMAVVAAWPEPATFSISGHIRDAAGNAILGVTVSADSNRWSTTDANGVYLITGLEAGTYTLRSSGCGWALSPSTRTVIVPPNRSGIDFTGTEVAPANRINLRGTAVERISPYWEVYIEEVISGPSKDGQIDVYSPDFSACEGLRDPNVAEGDRVEVCGQYPGEWPRVSAIDVCPLSVYYIKEIPQRDVDLALTQVSISSAPATAGEEVDLELAIKNVGSETYLAPTGYYEVQLSLDGRDQFWCSTKPTSWLDKTSLCEPISLSALRPGDIDSIRIEDFLFAIWSPGQKTIEAQFVPLDYDTNSENNAREITVTFLENPDPFQYCFGRAWAVFYDFYAAGGMEDSEKAVLTSALKAMAECAASNADCFYEELARALLELPVIAPLVSLAEAFEAIPVCWHAVWDFISNLIEALFRQGQDLNMVGIESPAYVRVRTTEGKWVGFLDDGSIVNEIEHATVSEIGGKKLILYPGQNTAEIYVRGTGYGILNLKLALSNQNASMDSVTYLNVSANPEMRAWIDTRSHNYSMQVDTNGDGRTDYTKEPDDMTTLWRYVAFLPLVVRD